MHGLREAIVTPWVLTGIAIVATVALYAYVVTHPPQVQITCPPCPTCESTREAPVRWYE